MPPHLSEAYAYLGMRDGDLPLTEKYAKSVLSIPLYNGMREEELEYVIRVINNFDII
ncbi:DegT/DnrJ/EryC1/StrS family aminotransferase [Butyrivibrio sp. YAB3001]|uniref:DegT/DnrJ/EryC1/StrS family aminotransferase n=1 Tax=Butyrivibrio sp. YAB3001 TaxID=1520812 RepID=UPI002E8E28F1|nr:DegT/DnrJ/EryC1/StrS family aminotransferase [Butyrivibrio sp. YAB3001]